ncbi:MAG: hypothetical protein GC181_03865 [Bacteroidetes bacterium]|nr:hypothetical protein [Bacteroidota bacterium]
MKNFRIVLAVLIFGITFRLSAQNADYRNAFGVNQDYHDYNINLHEGHLRNFDSSFALGIRLSYFRYLSKSWEWNTGLSNGIILNQQQGDVQVKRSYRFGWDGDFILKLYNGRIFPENGVVKPYLNFGYNLDYLPGFKKAGLAKMGFGNEYGAGIKVGLGPWSNLNFQFALIQNLSGDFDTYSQYRFGYIQTIGKKHEPKTFEKPQTIADYDQDGTVDSLDKCPTVKGIKNNYGCPDGWEDPIVAQRRQDSLLRKLDEMNTELLELTDQIDSLQNSERVVYVEKEVKSEPEIKPVVPPVKPKQEIVVEEPEETYYPNQESAPNRTEETGDYYNYQADGGGYYVIAISTKEKVYAEKRAAELSKQYPTVRILPQPNGFYRVGIYATADRDQADRLLMYAKTHGLPSGWLSLEK